MANRVWGICFALLASLCVGLAQDDGTTNKTVITADRLTFDYKKFTAVFESHVVVTDPRMKIESDELRVVFSKTNEVRSITAIGNVRLRSEDKTATCNRAVYLSETEEVVLTGNARLNRGRDAMTGDRITFYLNDNRGVAEGGTQLTIYPDKNQQNPMKLPKR